ncbi:MAG: hypothetical protein HQM09_09240 [Candidatus Riflebacteria bacterium]|nr:hypothetical protein [Candidatus Riflebacteria bacterium]
MAKKHFRLMLLIACAIFCTPLLFGAQGIMVKAAKGFATELEINVPELSMSRTEVLGRPAISLSIPGGSLSYDKSAPELPRLTAMVMIDPRRIPSVKSVCNQSEIITLDAPIVPSKGNFTRNIDPVTVPYIYGDVYSQDRWYPSDDQLVSIENPFILRNIRGVRLLVQPIQYNPVKNQLRIHRRLTVSLVGGIPDSGNELQGVQAISPLFEAIYQKTFVNYKEAASRLPRLNENGRLLIISYDAFADSLSAFISWKKKCGLDVKLVKLSEIGAAVTAPAIKNFIQKEYDLGGLTHIMLVGDAEQVPTLKGVKEAADSDPCYTKLAGNDDVPDCIISRLSATTPEEVAYQAAKFVNYEQFPSNGADAAWYKKGVCIASNQGNPTDFSRAGLLRDALLKWRFGSIDEIYDPKATKAMVSSSVNDGRSLINYIGHGSQTSWGTTMFSNADCAQLTNGLKQPVIWSVACVNGAFVGRTCFAEAWMRAGSIEKPAGAAAIFGSSTNQEWIPPCVVQNEIVTNYTVNETYKTVGGLAFNGIMKGMEVYGTVATGSGVMMFEQWHLFGDATMQVRFGEPKQVSAISTIKSADNARTLDVMISDVDGKPVSNAKVVAYTPKYEFTITSSTDEQGHTIVTLPAEFGKEGYMTVTGTNLVPVVDQKLNF